MLPENTVLSRESRRLYESMAYITIQLKLAEKEFNKLPEDFKELLFKEHNEGYSLNHCLRWGAIAAEELTEADDSDNLGLDNFWYDYDNGIERNKKISK